MTANSNYCGQYAYPQDNSNSFFGDLLNSDRIRNPAIDPFEEQQILNRLKRQKRQRESFKKKIDWRKEGF